MPSERGANGVVWPNQVIGVVRVVGDGEEDTPHLSSEAIADRAIFW